MVEQQEFLAGRIRRLEARIEHHTARKDLRAAIVLSEEACTLIRQGFGDDHPKFLPQLSRLAGLYRCAGDDAEALAAYSRVAALRRARYGRHSLQYAAALNSLGVLHCEMGHPRAALGVFERALAITRRHLPVDDPGVATLLNNLASAHHSAGHFPHAQSRYREALAILERHPQTGDALGHCLCDLAELEEERGRRLGALRLVGRAQESFRQALAQKPSSLALALARVASLLSRAGDHRTALSLLREALRHSMPEGRGRAPGFGVRRRLSPLHGTSAGGGDDF